MVSAVTSAAPQRHGAWGPRAEGGGWHSPTALCHVARVEGGSRRRVGSGRARTLPTPESQFETLGVKCQPATTTHPRHTNARHPLTALQGLAISEHYKVHHPTQPTLGRECLEALCPPSATLKPAPTLARETLSHPPNHCSAEKKIRGTALQSAPG